MAPKGKWLILLLFALLFAYGAAGLGISGSAEEAGPAPAAVQPAAPERAAVITNILASSVKVVLGQEETGGMVSDVQSSSGIVIYSEREPKPWSLVLTNAHAVSMKGLPEKLGTYVSYVAPRGRRVLRAKVVAEGSQGSVDLALLRVEGVSLPSVQFQEMGKVQLGSPVLVASSPFGRELSITSGIISQLYLSGPPAIEQACAPESPELCREPKPLQEIFKTDAPICYGSSGGGVFLASTGKLVGLVESYQSADIIIRPKAGEEYKIQIPVPGESFLISVNKIKYFLEQNGLDLDGHGVLLTAKQEQDS
jgi:serine protease Do